jgi:type II secretory pathway component PulF
MNDDLIIFTDQLYTLLKSGIALSKALGMIKFNDSNVAMQEAITMMQVSVERGLPLSAALEGDSEIFPQYYVESIRAAEASGIFQDTLNRLSVYLKAEKQLRYRIHSYFKYPRSVAGLMIVVALFLAWLHGYIVFGRNLIIIGTVAVVLIYSLRGMLHNWLKSECGTLIFDRIKLIIWPFNKVYKLHLQKMFALLIMSIYKTGISIIELFHLTGNAIPNRVFGAEITKIGDRIEGGAPLVDAIDSCSVLPPILKRTLHVGHEVGVLDKNFEDFVRKTELEINLLVKKYMLNIYILIVFILVIIAFNWIGYLQSLISI